MPGTDEEYAGFLGDRIEVLSSAIFRFVSEQLRGPQSYFPSIEARYAKPISHWLGVLSDHSDLTHMQMVNLLKSDHGIGHGHANALVAHFRSEESR